MMTYQTFTKEVSASGIVKITLNRPDKLNALNSTMLDELYEAFIAVQTDSAAKAILIIGEGKAFCAGADINRLAEADTLKGLAFSEQGQKVFRLLEALGKPSLAAINGYALGGGCELAMAATMRIASEKAQFGQPEVKLGVIPAYGGTQRLSRLIGKGRAIDLCVTGRLIDAQTAYQWGLVTEIVKPEELLNHAEQLLTMIIQNAPLAVSTAIRVINDGYDLPLDQALHLEAIEFALKCATADKKEGVEAFLTKRSAKFKGE